MNSISRTLILAIFLLEKELSATLTQGPSNTVAKIGEQSKLSCSATAQVAYWFISKTGNNTEEVAIAGLGCSVNLEFADHYAVESLNGGKTCNLIILNITMEQAGVYRCSDATNQLWSLFTVTDEFPAVTNNATLNVAVENQTMIITCSLNHNGSVSPAPTLRPYFYWTDSNGIKVNSSYDSTSDNTAVSQLTVRAGRQNIASFRCHVYMQLIPLTSPNYDGKIPTVDNGASSPPLEVQYSPGNISINSTISAEDKCVYQLEKLTCAADANPPAQYSWKDLSRPNSATTNGSTTNITSGGEYECFVYNQIGSQTYTDKKVATESTCHPAQNLTINGTNCADNFCSCNGNESYADPISITCMANGIPIPSVKWRSDNPFDGLYETIGVSHNGNYTCTGTNKYGGNEFNEELTVFVSDCKGGSNSLVWLCFLIIPGVGVIFGVVFIIPYDKTGKKIIYNKYFPFLVKMLPCMNTDVSATTFERCGWIILYILMVTTVGFIMIPIMFIRVQFCSSANAAVDINTVELRGTAHPENDAPPPKETTVDEKNNAENEVKKTKKKKKRKKVTD